MRLRRAGVRWRARCALITVKAPGSLGRQIFIYTSDDSAFVAEQD